ncbi:MAG: hypothetical protein V4574_08255 [Pseudomonadota bacterium]
MAEERDALGHARAQASAMIAALVGRPGFVSIPVEVTDAEADAVRDVQRWEADSELAKADLVLGGGY